MDLTTGQLEVLKAFDTLGKVDDGALAAYVHHMSRASMSSSGVRSRRAELVRKGALKITGTHRLKSGRRAAIHGLSISGRQALRASLKASKKSAKAKVAV